MGGGSSTQRSAKKAGTVVTTMRWKAAGKADAKKSALAVTQTALPSVDSGMDSDEPQLWHAIETAKATAATLDLTWSDQGYGNQKGMVYARKSGGQWVALSKSEAPHSPTRLSVPIPIEVLGGKLEFAYRVGGGGGHSLSIESAAIEVHGAAAVAVTQAWHDLPSVDSSKASDAPQLWHAIETAKATAATLECTWSDQGYGNQKGMVYARKAGGGQWVALSKSDAPHEPSRLSVAIPTEVLGGKLELAYRVGGGGGHSLSIESAAIEVHGAGRSGVLNVGEIKYTSMPHGARTPDSQTLCRSPSDSHT